MKIETSLRSGLAMWWIPLAFSIVPALLSSCKEQKREEPIPRFVQFTPTFLAGEIDSTKIFAAVEIPAGTTEIRGIDAAGIVHQDNRSMDFLPFPGNYGFVVGCGKIDSLTTTLVPLPVLVLMPALETESMVEINPIATLVLRKESSPFPVVIAIPTDTALQSIKVHNFVDFITEYDAARYILQQWFLNYRGREMFDLTGWQDERYTRQLIADWKRKD